MGIKPSDLRIGNIVEWDDDEMKGNKNTVIRDYDMSGFFVNPIALTKKILVKCGYEYEGDETVLYLGNGWSLSENADGGFEVIINHEYWITIHVDYLHQLQNAIWALSSFKKELEVNKILK